MATSNGILRRACCITLFIFFLARAGYSTEVPKRIVSVAPSFTEILYALGLDQQIVGTTNFCDYPPQALKTEKIGDVLNPNVEKIIGLHPDLVVLGHWKWDVPDKLRKVGINVAEINDAQNLTDSMTRVLEIGAAVGKKEKATEIVAQMQKRIADIAARTQSKPAHRAYAELDAGQWTVGSTSYLDEVLRKVGLVNIFSDRKEPYLMVTLESVISRDPEVLLSLHSKKSDYAQSSIWQTVTAVKNAKIIDQDAMDWNAITHQSPRLVDGIEQLEKLVDALFPQKP